MDGVLVLLGEVAVFGLGEVVELELELAVVRGEFQPFGKTDFRSRLLHLLLAAPRDIAANVNADDLRRGVDNLLSNAVRYSPPGSTVELSAQTTSSALAIAVRDRGPGFPPEFLPHAFERFRRADSARARDEGGSGLGLAIVQAVARAHGGDAEASNRPDGGAQVLIRIPRDHQR